MKKNMVEEENEIMTEEIKCPRCDSNNVVQTDMIETEDLNYNVLRCEDCGKVFTEDDVEENVR